MKKLLVLLVWFPGTFLTLVTTFFFLNFRNNLAEIKNKIQQSMIRAQTYKMYASVPKVLGASSASIKSEDAIPDLICEYLSRYRSPMAPSCNDFVTIFRNMSIDPIVPLAIAQCESNLGKIQPKDNCNNPFGLGIHSKGTLCFSKWSQGYEKMASDLKKNYLDKGYRTPDEIMKKYCPNSLEGGGTWAKCVKQFTDEIETLTIRRYSL